MNCEQLIPDAVNPPGACAAAAARHKGCYIEPAPLADVMFDQIEFLLTHASRPCPPGCADCARLVGVRAILLLPFNPTA